MTNTFHFIKRIMKLISHPKEGELKEKSLYEHLFNVAEKSYNEIKKQTLNLSLIKKEKIQRLSFLIGLFHDFGKATSWFQKYIRGLDKSSKFTEHSFFSAIIGYYAVQKEFSDLWAYVAFQVIFRHHQNLTSFDISGNIPSFALIDEKLKNILDNSFSELKNFYHKFSIELDFIKEIDFKDFAEVEEETDEILDNFVEDENDRIELFFITNYLFSLLIDSDKLDAARLDNKYFEGNLKEPQNDIQEYLKYCRENEPKKFDPKIPINKLRNEFLNEILNNNDISNKNHFYSITAPTGIGKTFGCLAFANKLKKQLSENTGRIIYCLPYTSIIDQNYIEFEKIIKFHKKEKYEQRPNRYLLKHHYLTPKEIINRKNYEEKEFKDYLDDQLLVESWQSAMIVTTFVQFFHTIIGYRNRFLKKFHNIINSIVILDEVQNINPDYYKLIQKTFKVLGERFGIYILLITATQPEILEKENIVNLIDSDKFMKSNSFNRVKLHIETKEKNLEEFTKNFYSTFDSENCLLVMNTKKFARKLYEKIDEYFPDYETYCLTTNLTPFDRMIQIAEIRKHLKDNDKIIVVSTQLIEAGVDFSFKNVYRDFGLLDSIIQVAGRCNRHNEFGETGGEMHLINLGNFKIYKRILSQYVNEIIINEKYESKDFYDLSKEYFQKFNFLSESKKLLNALKELNYDTNIKDQIPISKFSLIEENAKNTIFILRTEDAQKDMENLISLKRKLKEKLSKEEKDKIRIQIEKLKHRLLEFKIAVYENELENYIDLIEPQKELLENKNFPYQYLSYKDQKEYAYDEKLGFLKEPKKNVCSAISL